MSKAARSQQLLEAAEAMDLDRVKLLVAAGVRNNEAFLSDLGSTEVQVGKEAFHQMLERASQASGWPVETEGQMLFELYSSLLMAGHRVPDDGTRRCLTRVIAGADPSRHARAVDLMRLCMDQGMLDWRNSEWAMEIERQPGAKFMTPMSRPDEQFADAFGVAAGAGNLELLHLLAKQLPEDLHARRQMLSTSRSAAEKCVVGGNIACLAFLLELMPEDLWRNTSSLVSQPLTIVAAQAGKEAVLRWLVAQGFDIHALDERKESNILAMALEAKHPQMVPILLELGAQPDTCQKGAASPLNMACWHDMPTAVGQLIQAGENLHYQDNNGWSPLLIAAMAGHADCLRLLLDAGAPMELPDIDGLTPMALACRNDRLEAVELLIERGARLDLPGKDGQTARDRAKGRVLALLETRELEQQTAHATGRRRPGRV